MISFVVCFDCVCTVHHVAHLRKRAILTVFEVNNYSAILVNLKVPSG